MVDEKFLRYLAAKSTTDFTNVAREYLQHLFLSVFYSLKDSRHFLFKGGTALRIALGSPRFSQDLDFSGVRNSVKYESLLETTLLELSKQQLDVDLEIAMDNVDKLELLAYKYASHKTIKPETLNDDAYRKYKEEDLVWTRTFIMADFGQNDQILEDTLASLEAEKINEQVRLRRLQVQRSQKLNGVAVKTAQGRDAESDILRLQRTAEKLKGIRENLSTFKRIVIGSKENRSSLMPIVDEENVLYVDPIVFDDNDSLEFAMRWAATTSAEQENPEKAAKLADLVSENNAATVIPAVNELAQAVKQDGEQLSDQTAQKALDLVAEGAIEEEMPLIGMILPSPSLSRLGNSNPPKTSAIFPRVLLPSSPYKCASGMAPTPTPSSTIIMTLCIA